MLQFVWVVGMPVNCCCWLDDLVSVVCCLVVCWNYLFGCFGVFVLISGLLVLMFWLLCVVLFWVTCCFRRFVGLMS